MTLVPRDTPIPDRHVLEFVSEVYMLGLLVWREARSESYAGRAAVAHTVLNRVARPSWWGGTVLEVVGKKWQYSSLTAPGDPQLVKWPTENDRSWWECLQIAHDVLAAQVGNPVPGADSYYAVSIPAPDWAKPELFVGQVGAHRFYNLDRDVEAAVVNPQ